LLFSAKPGRHAVTFVSLFPSLEGLDLAQGISQRPSLEPRSSVVASGCRLDPRRREPRRRRDSHARISVGDTEFVTIARRTWLVCAPIKSHEHAWNRSRPSCCGHRGSCARMAFRGAMIRHFEIFRSVPAPRSIAGRPRVVGSQDGATGGKPVRAGREATLAGRQESAEPPGPVTGQFPPADRQTKALKFCTYDCHCDESNEYNEFNLSSHVLVA
jgi:hypothetical protein